MIDFFFNEVKDLNRAGSICIRGQQPWSSHVHAADSYFWQAREGRGRSPK